MYWTLLNGGLIIQEVEIEQIDPGVTLTKNFPISFPNEVMMCIAITSQVGFGAASTISCSAISKSQYAIHQNSPAPMQVNVFAIGY